MLIGDFYENMSQAKMLNSEKIDNKKYLVFEFDLKDTNKYRSYGRIWIDNRNYTPYKLNVYDEKGSIQVEITYDKFRFVKTNIF